MRVLASVAITADGALDDCTNERLRISSPEDWTEVARLRGDYDAILVGAATVRKDNPSLVISDQTLRTRREQKGMDPDIVKVTVTRTGCLAHDSRFFTRGEGRKIVFSEETLPHLDGLADVVVSPNITAAFIITELEKRGIYSLFVEGGVEMLNLFFAERMVDEFRLAINPNIFVSDLAAPRLDIGALQLESPHQTKLFGTTQVTTYRLRSDHPEDAEYMRSAIEASRQCRPSATSYCVGAVVVTSSGDSFRGYTHETSPTHHAEQAAIAKAQEAGAELRGATIYASMEPCSNRTSEPVSCSELILRLGFARVVFALYEPDCFVACKGALNLRQGGVEVTVIHSFAEQVREVNSHLLKK